LTDSIPGKNPENRLRDAFSDDLRTTMFNVKSLVDPKLNEDDVTILLVRRIAGSCKIINAGLVLPVLKYQRVHDL
jgi:hypothetical protein